MAKSKKLSKKDLTPAELFFYENAGYGYTPGKETKEEGRIRGAKKLAQAEAWAKQEDYEFVWRDEEEPWSTFLDGTEVDADEVTAIEWVGMYAPGDSNYRRPLQSLHGIMWNDDWKHTRDYKRVVEAELALEQFNEVFGKYGARLGNPESTSARWDAVAQRLAHGDV